MKFLLDTNICVYYLNGKMPNVRSRVNATPPTWIAISAITRGELFVGAAKSQQRERTRRRQEEFLARFASLPYDDVAAERYGDIYGSLEAAGLRIDKPDAQIAAIARVHNLIVVTRNTRHFSRVPDLPIEDWTVA